MSAQYTSLKGSSPSLSIIATQLPTPPMFFSCLPAFLVSLLAPFILSAPKDRELLLVGGYLYKFEKGPAKKLCGTPIPLRSLNAEVQVTTGTSSLHLTITSSTTTKHRYYQLPNEDDYDFFIATVRERKVENIKREMGHTEVETEGWKRADRAASSLVKRKGRIDEMARKKDRDSYEETEGLLR